MRKHGSICCHCYHKFRALPCGIFWNTIYATSVDWPGRRYLGQFIGEVEPVPISATICMTVFTISCDNASYDVVSQIVQLLIAYVNDPSWASFTTKSYSIDQRRIQGGVQVSMDPPSPPKEGSRTPTPKIKKK